MMMTNTYDRLGRLSSLPSIDKVVKGKEKALSGSLAAQTMGSTFQKMINTVRVAEELQTGNLLGSVDNITMVRATMEADLAVKTTTAIITKLVATLKDFEKLQI